MVIVDEKIRTLGNMPVTQFTLWADEAPADLQITGDDIGRPDATIAIGSTLETPDGTFKMGETGEFLKMAGGGSSVTGMDWGDVFVRNWDTDLVIDITEKSKTPAYITGNLLFTGTATRSGSLTSITFKCNSNQSCYIAEDCFKYNKNLSQIKFDRVGMIYDNAFLGCEVTGDVVFGLVVVIQSGAFESFACSKIKFGKISTVHGGAFKSATFSQFDAESINYLFGGLEFENCVNLTSFIIRSGTTSLNKATAFTGTPIESGTGYIYVPADLVDTYKAATNWSTYASQIRALENYTVDGTVTGELDPTKI